MLDTDTATIQRNFLTAVFLVSICVVSSMFYLQMIFIAQRVVINTLPENPCKNINISLVFSRALLKAQALGIMVARVTINKKEKKTLTVFKKNFRGTV